MEFMLHVFATNADSVEHVKVAKILPNTILIIDNLSSAPVDLL